VSLERRLPRQAERGAVHQDIRVVQQPRHRVKAVRPDPEARCEVLRARNRSIDHMHLGAALLQRVHRRAPGAACAKHERAAARHVPAARAFVEIRDEAMSVGIAAHQSAVLEPKGVHRAYGFGGFVATGDEAKGGLLVRHGDVAADIAVAGQIRDKGGKRLDAQVLQLVGARDAERLQPVAVDHRRARMRHRMAHYAGTAQRHLYRGEKDVDFRMRHSWFWCAPSSRLFCR